MAKKKADLVEQAKAAIDAVHSDTSVEVDETLRRLQDIDGHLDPIIEAVKGDVERIKDDEAVDEEDEDEEDEDEEDDEDEDEDDLD